MKGTKYAFTVNGEYEISGPSSSKKGTYVVSEDKQHFTLGEGGDQLNFDIVELSPTKLRFKNPKMPVVLVCTPSASASK